MEPSCISRFLNPLIVHAVVPVDLSYGRHFQNSQIVSMCITAVNKTIEKSKINTLNTLYNRGPFVIVILIIKHQKCFLFEYPRVDYCSQGFRTLVSTG